MKGCKMKDYKTKSGTLGRVSTSIVYKLHSIFWAKIIEYLFQSKLFFWKFVTYLGYGVRIRFLLYIIHIPLQ